MKNRIIGIIFLTVFVSINLWAVLTKNYSNSFLAGIAGMCLVTAILYLRKGKKKSNFCLRGSADGQNISEIITD